MIRRVAIMMALLVVVTSLSGGCAYMKNRGNDALDIFDVGVTFTKTPRVAVYAGFLGLLGAGYSGVEDGYMVGLGQRQAGVLHMRYNAAGAVLDGYQNYQFGQDALPPAPAEPNGVGLGLTQYDVPESFVEFVQCPKYVHLLFVGVNLNCKLGELIDFLSGWTTLDIGHDDVHGKDAAIPQKSAAPAK